MLKCGTISMGLAQKNNNNNNAIYFEKRFGVETFKEKEGFSIGCSV